MESAVRVGIVGVGGMGLNYARLLSQGKVAGARLAAVCDLEPERLAKAGTELGDSVLPFDRPDRMFASAACDGVLIVTPHFHHPVLCIGAFRAGLHVLTDKPAGVFTRNVREANAAAAASGKVFGIMFNQRHRPLHRKLRDLVAGGGLGPVLRTQWVATNWFRSQCYYDAGGWRATWAGEGGGVLLNQCPHNLDLWQWICGMPKRVRAFCSFGKYHDIEVEDDVTAYVEYAGGATGVFIASTGESPGTNRLEVVCDRGKVVMEDGRLACWQTRESVAQFCRESRAPFAEPECVKSEIAGDAPIDEHLCVIQNWVRAIVNGEELVAPGREGVESLTLSNAMLLSAWTDEWVDLPLDEDRFHDLLQQRIAGSRYARRSAKPGLALDMGGSFR